MTETRNAGTGTGTPSLDEQMEQKLAEWKARWAELRADMEREFDEMRVQAHLGKEDAKDQWERVESRFREFSANLDGKGDAVEDIVREKMRLISAELKDGMERLRKLF